MATPIVVTSSTRFVDADRNLALFDAAGHAVELETPNRIINLELAAGTSRPRRRRRRRASQVRAGWLRHGVCDHAAVQLRDSRSQTDPVLIAFDASASA